MVRGGVRGRVPPAPHQAGSTPNFTDFYLFSLLLVELVKVYFLLTGIISLFNKTVKLILSKTVIRYDKGILTIEAFSELKFDPQSVT